MNSSKTRSFFSIAVCCCASALLFGGHRSALASTINVGAGTITGLGAGSGTVTFSGISGGVATFVVNGDLNIDPSDVVSVTNNGSNAAINIVVGNDVNV